MNRLTMWATAVSQIMRGTNGHSRWEAVILFETMVTQKQVAARLRPCATNGRSTMCVAAAGTEDEATTGPGFHATLDTSC